MSGKNQATQAEREAARWIARLEASDVSLDDHRRFRRWLAGAPENRPAYEAVAKTWDGLDALRHLHAEPPSPQLSRRALLAGTAGVAALVGGAVLFGVAQTAEATPYSTAIGERKTVTLADGSSAELNADTRMRVAIAARERRVRLEQGEALFEARQEENRPFVVETGFGELRVRGTTFLVRIGADGARATVIRGVVEGVGGTGPLGMFSSRRTVTAQAGEEISFQTAGIESSALPPQTLERRLAWREGMLAFDGETLREAALDIERQTGVRFEFAEPSIGDLRIGGYISATDVTAFDQLLEQNFALRVERRSANTVWLGRR